VRVIPLGVPEEYSPPRTFEDEEALDRLRQRYALHRPFVLNVGGFDTRKRLPQLVRGFAATLPALEEEYDLVIVGRPHTANPRLYPPLEPLIGELGVAERVRLVGFVSEEDKRDFYRAAEVFVFASEYEGFGFNPLEAMACGAPVICSNRTSLPEIVGDAGLLVEPEPDAIAEALVSALSSPDLRADLSLRGLERAKQFSWARCAELTIAAYREVLGHGMEQAA
jgi:glycosyltransferase involved in cell wall biosynthesis